MPSGGENIIEILPSAVAGVHRMLLRVAGGGVVEAVEIPVERLATLPAGGVFAAFTLGEDRVILGPLLQRRLVDLGPPPLAALGFVSRLLDDLELLHRGGGAHGALAIEGIGVDDRSELVVRPALHLAQELSPAGDVRAVGTILAALADRAKLDAAGVPRSSLLLSGFGVDSARVGFADARAARQALAVVVRGLRVEEALASFLAGLEVRLPAPARAFQVRPVAIPRTPPGADRASEARAWLDRSLLDLQRDRVDREAKLNEEADRLTDKLFLQTAAALAAARAVAAGEPRRPERTEAETAAEAAADARRRVERAEAADRLAERVAADAEAAERREAERREAERRESERRESELVAAAAKLAADQVAESERSAAEKAEAAERREAERVAAEAEAAERKESERREAAVASAAVEAAAESERLAAVEVAELRASEHRAAVSAAETERLEAAERGAVAAAQTLAEKQAAAAERSEAVRVAAAARRVAASAPAATAVDTLASDPVPSSDSEPWQGTSDAPGEDGGSARWEGTGGVRGDPSRMNEKGPGKWTLQGRSREELAEQLPPGESRPLDLSPQPARPVGLYVVLASVAAGVLAWAVL